MQPPESPLPLQAYMICTDTHVAMCVCIRTYVLYYIVGTLTGSIIVLMLCGVMYPA